MLPLESIVEVVALHDHIVEFQEGKALLHALFVAFRTQHVIHGEMRADVPDEIDVIKVQQPVRVVQHAGFALAEFDEAFHLLLKAGGVVVDGLAGQHLAHVSAAGRVTDHGRAAADQGDGLIPGLLQALHQGKRHEMPCGQAVRRAVKSDVEGRLSFVDQFLDLFFVGHLRDQSACDQFVI